MCPHGILEDEEIEVNASYMPDQGLSLLGVRPPAAWIAEHLAVGRSPFGSVTGPGSPVKGLWADATAIGTRQTGCSPP